MWVGPRFQSNKPTILDGERTTSDEDNDSLPDMRSAVLLSGFEVSRYLSLNALVDTRRGEECDGYRPQLHDTRGEGANRAGMSCGWDELRQQRLRKRSLSPTPNLHGKYDEVFGRGAHHDTCMQKKQDAVDALT